MYEAGIPYFLTIRCLHGRLFLRPSERTNEIVGGVLARAARLASVEIFAFVFASNHVHLLVRAPVGNLSQFMQHLLANISRKVGAVVGWRGAFWERRYSAEPVLDEEALLGRIRYILSHGVKEGLVASCREWPGLSSLSMMLDDEPRRFRWFHWSYRWRNRNDGKPLLASTRGVRRSSNSFSRLFLTLRSETHDCAASPSRGSSTRSRSTGAPSTAASAGELGFSLSAHSIARGARIVRLGHTVTPRRQARATSSGKRHATTRPRS